jgi:hypothetical protein
MAPPNSKAGMKKGQLYVDKQEKHDLKKSGNPYIRLYAERGGKPLACETPEKLLDEFANYVSWAHRNTLKEEKAASMKGIPTKQKLNKKRLLTLAGFALYCGRSESWFHGMRKPDFKQRDKFGPAIHLIEDFVRQDQIEGASADLLNANIVIRLQGLKEKIDHSTNDQPLEFPAIQVIASGPPINTSEAAVEKIYEDENKAKKKK